MLRKHVMLMAEYTPQINDEVWVSTSEGAEMVGYYRDHVQKLARWNWELPEDKRAIQVRKRRHGYDIWLPDLVRFAMQPKRGRPLKNNKLTP